MEGGFLLVHMISTCLRGASTKGRESQHVGVRRKKIRGKGKRKDNRVGGGGGVADL
jgi:hypothetical protein